MHKKTNKSLDKEMLGPGNGLPPNPMLTQSREFMRHMISIIKPHLGLTLFTMFTGLALLNVLTHWGRDKMVVLFQTTFLNGFSSMKMYRFRLRFHWSLFPRAQITIFQHWLRYWLGAGQATSHYMNHWWLVYWRIYVSLGFNEFSEYVAQNVFIESSGHWTVF